MQIQDIKRRVSNRKKKYIGRGGRRGKTAGRGTKGQNARAGRKKRPEIRDIIKKLPKRRGYRTPSIRKPVVVKVENDKETYSVIRKRLNIKGGKIKK